MMHSETAVRVWQQPCTLASSQVKHAEFDGQVIAISSPDRYPHVSLKYSTSRRLSSCAQGAGVVVEMGCEGLLADA